MWCCILLRKIKGAVFVPAYPLAHMPIKVVVVYIHPEALIQVHPKFNMAAHQCRRKSSQTFTGYISDSAVVFSAVVSYSLLVTIELYSTARQSIYKWLMNTTCSQILSSLAASASSIWLISLALLLFPLWVSLLLQSVNHHLAGHHSVWMWRKWGATYVQKSMRMLCSMRQSTSWPVDSDCLVVWIMHSIFPFFKALIQPLSKWPWIGPKDAGFWCVLELLNISVQYTVCITKRYNSITVGSCFPTLGLFLVFPMPIRNVVGVGHRKHGIYEQVPLEKNLWICPNGQQKIESFMYASIRYEFLLWFSICNSYNFL